ncbi:HTTM domain-containing protein [Natranaeroarchaeum sulfidigenes]|uniref:HTTM domain containing membrane enzyme n=1 Tax=Natranaeroarchaeum sulfidigenes TaxID=2784880 RepID=A0A897ML22_9EURY|nr:HTTM domain-containing protein [Natranaeroarchaeum sulfidigenes]QSG01254.1 HTTM domain containing membrane enzyme [Natranaeroarchaeum sulfidigenes]
MRLDRPELTRRVREYRPDSDRFEPILQQIRARFEVDTRSLAALRILLGVTLLVDLGHRAGDIERHYTDAGVYPLEAFELTYISYNGLSVHALSGDLWFQQLLFAIAATFAVLFVLGYRTRLVGTISLLLLFSLHARNPAILNGADRLLRVLLLVALLTPLGERWSIDALRRGHARVSVASMTTVALLVQPIVVFTQNAYLKREGDTWYTGEALEIALSNDAMTIHLGNALAQYPALLELLTFLWVWLLAGSSVFLLLTAGWLRTAFALVYIGAFAGMAVSMAVGLFPLVLIAAVLPFFTRDFWERGRRIAPYGTVITNRLTASTLGPLERPPIEQRVLTAIRKRGHHSMASFAVTYGHSLLTVLGVLVLAWMLLFGGAHATEYEVPHELDSTHLDEQRWGLYAPDPGAGYSWYAVEAELETGDTVDALDDNTGSSDPPPDAAQEYDGFRDRKLLETVRDSGLGDRHEILAGSYVEWACDRAETVHGDSVQQLTVTQYIQPDSRDGTVDDISQRTITERDC